MMQGATKQTDENKVSAAGSSDLKVARARQGGHFSLIHLQVPLVRKIRSGGDDDGSNDQSDFSESLLVAALSSEDLQKIEILLATHARVLDFFHPSKLVTYIIRGGDRHIGKILDSQLTDVIALISDDQLKAYAHDSSANVEKILNSRSGRAISLIPKDKLILYMREGDAQVEKVLASQSLGAIDQIPPQWLRDYARGGDANVEKLLVSRSDRAVSFIPEQAMLDYLHRSDKHIATILNSRVERAIAYLADLTGKELAIEAVLNSRSARAISWIPDERLAAYARKGNKCIEDVLNSHSTSAISLIASAQLKAYVAKEGDEIIEKILDSLSGRATDLIPEDRLKTYASKGDSRVEKILNAGSERAVLLIADQLKAYARKGDAQVEKILRSGSEEAFNLIAEQLKVYAGQGDAQIEKILQWGSDKAIDLITEQLKVYARQGDAQIEKILDSQLDNAIDVIPGHKLQAYARTRSDMVVRILNSRSARAINLIPEDKLVAYISAGDAQIEKVLASQSFRAINQIPRFTLMRYSRGGDENIEKILASKSSQAIKFLSYAQLIAYASKGDAYIEKILDSRSEQAIESISNEILKAYLNRWGDSGIEKILSSRDDLAIGTIPKKDLKAYACKGDAKIEKILSSESDRAIELIPHDYLSSYINRVRLRFRRITASSYIDRQEDWSISDLSHEDKRVLEDILGYHLGHQLSWSNDDVEKVLRSRVNSAISWIPDERLASYARHGNKHIEEVLNSRSTRAISLIAIVQLRAYVAKEGDNILEKILDALSSRATDLIPEDRLKAYASKGDSNVEKLLNAGSRRVVILIADQLKAYARKGDAQIEKILRSGSEEALNLVVDQLKAYASKGDVQIGKILQLGSDRAIDLIAEQLRAYASQGDVQLGKILNSQRGNAIDLIPEYKLPAYARYSSHHVERILNSGSHRAIGLIPSEELKNYVAKGNAEIEEVLNSHSATAIRLIPQATFMAYIGQHHAHVERVLDSCQEIAISKLPSRTIRDYLESDAANMEKVLRSRSNRVIKLIPPSKLRAFFKKNDANIEKILSTRSNIAISAIPDYWLKDYARRGYANIEKILNSRSERAIATIPSSWLRAYARQRDANVGKIITSGSDKAIASIPYDHLSFYAYKIFLRFEEVREDKRSAISMMNARKAILKTIPVEECLPGPSTYRASRRKRREAVNELCEFSWEEIDEFNEEKEELRGFNEIRINSEKFLALLENPSLSETKRVQLLQLADKVSIKGPAKARVLDLVKHQKVLLYLNNVNHLANRVMLGIMAKDVLRDFLQQDYLGLAINVGFIAGGQGFKKIAEVAAIAGEDLAMNGQRLLGGSLRLASPFLARGTSAFVVYDLIKQIKAYQQGDPDALGNVGVDSFYLTIDIGEVGVEIAEVFGVLEGVSSVTGPIGATIGALLFVGSNIYSAVKQVNREDALIHLTEQEKLIEGWRAFLGMKPEHHIETLLEEKQINTQWYWHGLSFLKNNTHIQRYVLPTATFKQKCAEVVFSESERKCLLIGIKEGMVPGAIALGALWGGGCQRPQLGNKCTNSVEMNLDNVVLFNREIKNRTWSRTKPEVSEEGKLFCVPVASRLEENSAEEFSGSGGLSRIKQSEAQTLHALFGKLQEEDEIRSRGGTYFCDQAMGIEYLGARTGNMTLMVLGDGNDTVVSFPYGDHLLILGNGHKDIRLGKGDDTFLLDANLTTGALFGGGGINTLDLGSFAKEQPVVSVANLARGFLGQSQTAGYYVYWGEPLSQNNTLKLVQLHRFLLRVNKPDYMEVACSARFVDAGGGHSRAMMDRIRVPESEAHCVYNLTLMLRPYTDIENYHQHNKSRFTYIVPLIDEGYAQVQLSHRGGSSSSHRFVFAGTLLNIHQLRWEGGNSSIVDFLKSKNVPGRVFEFKVIMATPHKLLYQLSDNTEIKVSDGHFYAFQSTNRSVEEIIKDYSGIAERLKLTMIIQSQLTNESIAIGHGQHDVLHNDPYRQSHLVGNGGENIFVITAANNKVLDASQLPLPDVVLYDLDAKNLIDTLDLRQIKKQLESDLGLDIQARTSLLGNHDIAIELFSAANPFKCLLTVRLKDALLTNWHKRLHIILYQVVMELDALDLKPLPLELSADKDMIIIDPDDVEKNMKIVLSKSAGDYRFMRLENDLIMTNGFAFNVTEAERYALFFRSFYQTEKLKSVVIKFSDKELVLEEAMGTIAFAADFALEYEFYHRLMHNRLFNETGIEGSRRPVRHVPLLEEEKKTKTYLETAGSYLKTVSAYAFSFWPSVIAIAAIFPGVAMAYRYQAGRRFRGSAIVSVAQQATVAMPLLSSTVQSVSGEQQKLAGLGAKPAYNTAHHRASTLEMNRVGSHFSLAKYAGHYLGFHSAVKRMNKAEEVCCSADDAVMSALDLAEQRLAKILKNYDLRYGTNSVEEMSVFRNKRIVTAKSYAASGGLNRSTLFGLQSMECVESVLISHYGEHIKEDFSSARNVSIS